MTRLVVSKGMHKSLGREEIKTLSFVARNYQGLKIEVPGVGYDGKPTVKKHSRKKGTR